MDVRHIAHDGGAEGQTFSWSAISRSPGGQEDESVSDGGGNGRAYRWVPDVAERYPRVSIASATAARRTLWPWASRLCYAHTPAFPISVDQSRRTMGLASVRGAGATMPEWRSTVLRPFGPPVVSAGMLRHEEYMRWLPPHGVDVHDPAGDSRRLLTTSTLIGFRHMDANAVQTRMSRTARWAGT